MMQLTAQSIKAVLQDVVINITLCQSQPLSVVVKHLQLCPQLRGCLCKEHLLLQVLGGEVGALVEALYGVMVTAADLPFVNGI